MNVQVFRKTWNRDPARQRIEVFEFDMSADATIAEILAFAYESGIGKGTAQTGIIEVQTDLGIYAREDGCRLDVSTAKRAAKVKFTSWDDDAAA